MVSLSEIQDTITAAIIDSCKGVRHSDLADKHGRYIKKLDCRKLWCTPDDYCPSDHGFGCNYHLKDQIVAQVERCLGTCHSHDDLFTLNKDWHSVVSCNNDHATLMVIAKLQEVVSGKDYSNYIQCPSCYGLNTFSTFKDTTTCAECWNVAIYDFVIGCIIDPKDSEYYAQLAHDHETAVLVEEISNAEYDLKCMQEKLKQLTGGKETRAK